MSTPILTTKLYIPPPRPNAIRRPRLVERLNEGLRCKLTLISAAAGFGKTTLVSAWVASLSSELQVLSSELSKTDQTQNSTLNTQNFSSILHPPSSKSPSFVVRRLRVAWSLSSCHLVILSSWLGSHSAGSPEPPLRSPV